MAFAVGAPLGRVLARGSPNVRSGFGLYQPLQCVLENRAQDIDVGSSQLVEQVGRGILWVAIRGPPWLVVRDPNENPAVALVVYSPPREPATSLLHHITGRD